MAVYSGFLGVMDPSLYCYGQYIMPGGTCSKCLLFVVDEEKVSCIACKRDIHSRCASICQGCRETYICDDSDCFSMHYEPACYGCGKFSFSCCSGLCQGTCDTVYTEGVFWCKECVVDGYCPEERKMLQTSLLDIAIVFCGMDLPVYIILYLFELTETDKVFTEKHKVLTIQSVLNKWKTSRLKSESKSGLEKRSFVQL